MSLSLSNRDREGSKYRDREGSKSTPFIDQTSKDLIHGFLRFILECFYWENTQSPYYSVPPLVHQLCLLYWYEHIDEFNNALCGDRIQIFDHGASITYIGATETRPCNPCSVFGSKMIPSVMDRVYIWTLRMEGLENRGTNVGIIDAETGCLDSAFDVKRDMVQYSLSLTGSLWSWKGFVGRSTLQIQRGDSLRMELTLSHHKGSALRYYWKSAGGKKFASICDSKTHKMTVERRPGLKYRLAVTLSNEGNAMKLIDYEEIELLQPRQRSRQLEEQEEIEKCLQETVARSRFDKCSYCSIDKCIVL